MGALAGEYLLLGAEFLGAIQVIVYAGAIMVVFVFVIMLLNAGEEERTKGSRVALLFGVPGMLTGSLLIAWVLMHSGLGSVEVGALPGPPKTIARLLFHDFLLPFEVTSVLVLIAIMGAVVLAARPHAAHSRRRTNGTALLLPGAGRDLFACGVTGFLIKRNLITLFMSIELMLNGVNLSFVAFAAHWQKLSGQVFVFFVMVVAAAEAAVGLAIIIAVFRTRETLNVDHVNLLKL